MWRPGAALVRSVAVPTRVVGCSGLNANRLRRRSRCEKERGRHGVEGGGGSSWVDAGHVCYAKGERGVPRGRLGVVKRWLDLRVWWGLR